MPSFDIKRRDLDGPNKIYSEVHDHPVVSDKVTFHHGYSNENNTIHGVITSVDATSILCTIVDVISTPTQEYLEYLSGYKPRKKFVEASTIPADNRYRPVYYRNGSLYVEVDFTLDDIAEICRNNLLAAYPIGSTVVFFRT